MNKHSDPCDAAQRQISAAADSGEPLSADVEAHAAACPDCAAFAARWQHGAPAALRAEPAPNGPLNELRERILDRNAAPLHVVRFPTATRRAPASRSAWVGRIAAGVLLAAFSYWLLDPVAAPPASERSSADAGPTLGQGLSKLEDQSKSEREALVTAMARGGREVHDSALWSVTALEL